MEMFVQTIEVICVVAAGGLIGWLFSKLLPANLQKPYLFPIIGAILLLSFTSVILSGSNSRSNPIPQQTILSKGGDNTTFTLYKGSSKIIHVIDDVITITLKDNGNTISNQVDINISGTIGSSAYNDFSVDDCIHLHPILITYVNSRGNGLSGLRFESAKFTVYALHETVNETKFETCRT